MKMYKNIRVDVQTWTRLKEAQFIMMMEDGKYHSFNNVIQRLLEVYHVFLCSNYDLYELKKKWCVNEDETKYG